MLTTTATARRPRIYFPFRRTLIAIPLVAMPIALCVDLGSVALVHLQAEDNATEAGRAGMAAIQFEREATPRNAEIAYQAASGVADLHRLQIDPDTFTIYADGAIELTARRTAPTLLFKHLPGLRDLAESEVTTTVERPNW